MTLDLSALLTGDEGKMSHRWHLTRDEYTLRNARSDEDFRSIDWKSSSRSPVLIARDYGRRQGGRIWVVVDLTPTMRFHTGEVSKLSVVQKVAETLDASAREQGAALGAATYPRLAPLLPPTDRHDIAPHISSWCARLSRYDVEWTIADILHELLASWLVQKRDSFLLISDDQMGLVDILERLHRPTYALCIQDRVETGSSDRVGLPISAGGGILSRFSRFHALPRRHPALATMILGEHDPLAVLASLLSSNG